MDNIGWHVFRTITDQWRKVVSGLQSLGRGSAIHPPNPHSVFFLEGHSNTGPIRLRVDPILLKLPERANDAARNLYVVLEGYLAFNRPANVLTPLATCDFGTRIGYFRHKPAHGRLDHVYGAHYDLDTSGSAHPVCHAQFASYLHFGQQLVNQFHLPHATDSVSSVLRTVRSPTAQMDVFSVLRQLCADHLVGENPGPSVLHRFRAISTDCMVAQPIRPHVESSHWYP